LRSSQHLVAVFLCAAAAVTCNGDPVANPPDVGDGTAPTLTAPNVAVGVTVGAPVSYDATKGGSTFTASGSGGLGYSITFAGAANGLTAQGGIVTGQPLAPGVTWVTIVATDAQARTASDRFAVVAFTPGLATPTLPPTSFRYADASVPLLAHFRATIDGASVAATDNTPADNPITDAGAGLGRVLFYDTRVSANDRLSCAGCHNPSIGFSDTPQRSVGFAGELTPRHSPGLANARFYRRGHFFWDERAATLEAQVLRPIQDGSEMGLTLDDLAAKLAATPYYPELFTAAFGTATVTSDRVSKALAQYVRSLVSADSRYDHAFTGSTPNFAAVFTAQELEGERLFRSTGCAGCHATVAQVSDSVHNVGLDALSADTGAGRGAFKAPSLRNVAVRPRFMHDGRFTTLEQVIDFFDSGVQPNPDLDPRLRAADGSPKRLRLTAAQKAALVTFLRTLTDSTFLTAPRFADPFAPPTNPRPPGPPPPTAAVTIQASAYHPATLTVAPGTVVTWTNLDNLGHSATFASALVGSTPLFTSGSQQLTMPTAPGTYPYQCTVHGAAMRGTVVVP
jgi:cytochrome c peroxidase